MLFPAGEPLGAFVIFPAGEPLGAFVTFPAGEPLGAADASPPGVADGSVLSCGASVVPDGSVVGVADGDRLGLTAAVADVCGFVVDVAAGSFDAICVPTVAVGVVWTSPAFLTVTVIVHFFIPFAVNVTFAFPAFFPVSFTAFFTTFTLTIFLFDAFALSFAVAFFTFTVTVFPTDTVTLLLLTFILLAASALWGCPGASIVLTSIPTVTSPESSCLFLFRIIFLLIFFCSVFCYQFLCAVFLFDFTTEILRRYTTCPLKIYIYNKPPSAFRQL